MTIRLVHLSDPHFGRENAEAVEAAIAVAREFAPDLTIVSGDLTSDGRAREFEAAADWLGRLPQPQIVTPGNHDAPQWDIWRRLFSPFSRYRRHIGDPLRMAAHRPGLMVSSLNTARGAQPRLDWSKGVINLAAVRAVANEMRSAPNALKVFVCHHALVETEGAAVTSGVHRGGAAARILAEAGVDLILSGHVHHSFVLPLPFGEGRSYAVGAGTLSLRTRGAPASFSTIEADADAIKVMVLKWSGAVFEPGAVWTLPRRTGALLGGIDATEPQMKVLTAK